MTLIAGSGGGGKGGGSSKPRVPVEHDDSLQSVQYATVIDLIGEGEIQGLETGDAKSIFLDGTPILNNAGQPNFQNYSSDFRVGTQGQAAFSQSKGTESVETVNATPTNTNGTDAQRIAGSVVRSITNTNVDALRVTLTLGGLQRVEDDGDIVGNTVRVQIEVKYDSGSYTSIFGAGSTGQNITGKSSSSYQRDYRINLNNFTSSCTIRVSRVTIDSSSAKNTNAFTWSTYTTIIEERFRYPNSALSYLRFDSRSFQNVPQRKYWIRGIKVRLPSNASVDTTNHIGRVTYSGVWNGNFGAAKWCSDPAWILWDLMTDTRYGAGIPENSLDTVSYTHLTLPTKA